MFNSLAYCLCAGEFCNRYTVRFILSAEAKGPTEIKFYYTLPSKGDFNETNAQSFLVNNEANTAYDGVYDIFVPHNENIRLWRFDLGDKPGNIKVDKVSINDRAIDDKSIDMNNLIFSPDLALAEYKDGEFSFVSKGHDPYFVINQEIPCKASFSIKNADLVLIVFLFSFFVSRDMLKQYKKIRLQH